MQPDATAGDRPSSVVVVSLSRSCTAGNPSGQRDRVLLDEEYGSVVEAR